MHSHVFYACVKVWLNWQQKRATCFATMLPGGGVFLGNLGGVVPHGTPNPAAISERKSVILNTRFQTWPRKLLAHFQT